jgi:hypothetical protein
VRTDAPYIDLSDVVTQWEQLCKKRDTVVKNAPITQLPGSRRMVNRIYKKNKIDMSKF